jgi:hypothetical protein
MATDPAHDRGLELVDESKVMELIREQVAQVQTDAIMHRSHYAALLKSIQLLGAQMYCAGLRHTERPKVYAHVPE